MYKIVPLLLFYPGRDIMDNNIMGQISVLKVMNIKPNFSDLARQYGLDRRTVKKYYNGYKGKAKTRNKPSKLDKYRSEIVIKLSIKGVTVKGVYEYFKDKGCDIGTYSNFNKYIKKNGLLPKKKIKGHPRFETPPGKQAQVDWKENIHMISRSGKTFIINVFSFKLGNSRLCHFTYRRNKTHQDLFESLIAAFKFCGGVPREIVFDNMKTAADISNEGRKVNNKLQAFADDFGFKIYLCKPRHAYTKGKVESANKFIEWILPYNYEFETEDDLINIIKNINSKVNSSPNQSTGVPPLLLFQKEKEHLLPLPNQSIIESYMDYTLKTKVHKDSLINYCGNKYSVPCKYIDKFVTLKATNQILHIYFNTELIATHIIADKKINYRNEDYKELLGNSIKDEDDLESYSTANLECFDNLLSQKGNYE